jgi:catechol 2,3-dioxygenase-like lactoylglutathione lyase family enzyme
VDQRISVITLGVADVQESAAFYERLGWKRSSQSQDGVAFFDVGGLVLGLFGREALAEDAGGTTGTPGSSDVTLAHNVGSPAEVDTALADAQSAGARIVKPASETFWGGYSGYFADPDGHLWEIAHNPFWPLNDKGQVLLPE